MKILLGVKNRFLTALFWLFDLFDYIVKVKDETLIPWFKDYWPRCTILTANALTSYRILISCCIIYLLFDFANHRYYIFVLFAIGVILDFIDGLVARAHDNTSTLGAFLDRLSDKMLVLPIFVYIFWPISGWIVFIIVLVEVGSTIFSIIAIWLSINIASNPVGKYKMLLAVITVFLILIFNLPVLLEVGLISGVIVLAIVSFLLHFYSEYLSERPKHN